MTLRDKIAEIIFANKHSGSQYTADAILALPEIVNLQKKLAEVEAALEFCEEQACTIEGGYHSEKARAEAAEAIVEQLTNNPDYLTVYRKGFEDGKTKLAEVQTMSEAPETIWASRDGFWFRVGPEYARTVEYLRADLPADLVERVKGSE